MTEKIPPVKFVSHVGSDVLDVLVGAVTPPALGPDGFESVGDRAPDLFGRL